MYLPATFFSCPDCKYLSSSPIQNECFHFSNIQNFQNENVTIDSKLTFSKFKEFKIGSLNTCGLKSKCQYLDFIEKVQFYDIFCVQETKLD